MRVKKSKKPIPGAALWAEPAIPTWIRLLHWERGTEPAKPQKPSWVWGDFSSIPRGFPDGSQVGSCLWLQLLWNEGIFIPSFQQLPNFARNEAKIWFSRRALTPFPMFQEYWHSQTSPCLNDPTFCSHIASGSPQKLLQFWVHDWFSFPNPSNREGSTGWNWGNGLDPWDLGWEMDAGI